MTWFFRDESRYAPMTYDIEFTEGKPQSILLPQAVVVKDKKVEGEILSILLKLLSPLFWILKQTATLILWINIRFFQDRIISQSAKCPACGIRETHVIQYAEDYGAVIHTCGRCKGEWGEATIVPCSKWAIKREIVEKQRNDGLPSIME